MTSHERIVEWNVRSRGDDFNVGFGSRLLRLPLVDFAVSKVVCGPHTDLSKSSERQSTEISGKSKDDWCVYETGINSILASRVVCWWYQLPEV